jgi:hypothetical protein
MNMRKRVLLPASFLLFLSISLLIPAPRAFSGRAPRQDQPPSPKFYALQVVYEKKVQNAKDSLGPPDGRSAEILPGGQIVVLMANMLSSSRIVGNIETAGCIDSGSMIGKGETDFGLEGRFVWHDAQGEKHQEWTHLTPTLTGFCAFPPSLAVYSHEDKAGMDMIRITNTGTNSLFLDAVIGYVQKY